MGIMITNIIEEEEEDVSEERVIDFFLDRVGLRIPFEQVEAFFKPEDLPRVKELWAIAEEEWKPYEEFYYSCNGKILRDEKWEGM